MRRGRSPKQLFIGYVSIAVAVVVLAGLGSLYMVRNLYVQQTAEDLQARARLCSMPIVQALKRNETDAVDALCKELGKAVNTRITVVRLSGEVVGDTEENPQEMENHADRPEIKQVIDGPSSAGQSTRYSTTLKETLMYVAVAAPEGSSPVAVVRASIPITTVAERLSSANQGVATAGLVAILLMIAAIPWFSIRFDRLTEETKRRSREPEDDERPESHTADAEHAGSALE